MAGRYSAFSLLLLAVALLLRLIFLGKMSLWMDEGWTAYLASLPLNELFAAVAREENQPPLYHLLVHFFLVAGNNEFILRLPAALFGALTAVLTFTVGRRFVSDGAARLAGFFVAGSSFMLLFSREARMAPLTAFLILLNFLFLDKLLKREGKYSGLFYSLTLAAAWYSSYLAFLLLFAQGIYLVFRKKPLKEWLPWMTLAAVFYLPWVACFLTYHNWTKGFWGHLSPSASAVLDAFYSQGCGFTLYFSALWQYYLLAGGALALFLFGSFPRKGREDKLNYALIPWSFWLFLLTTFILARVTDFKIWESKYLYVVAPFFWLTAAHALQSLRSRLLKQTLIGTLVIINLVSFSNLLFQPEWGRQDNRQVADWLSKRYRKGDIVFVVPSYQQHALEYYLRAGPLPLIPMGKKEVERFFLPDATKNGRLFLVRGPWWLADPENSVRERISRKCSLVDSMETVNLNAGFILSVEIYTFQ